MLLVTPHPRLLLVTVFHRQRRGWCSSILLASILLASSSHFPLLLLLLLLLPRAPIVSLPIFSAIPADGQRLLSHAAGEEVEHTREEQ